MSKKRKERERKKGNRIVNEFLLLIPLDLSKIVPHVPGTCILSGITDKVIIKKGEKSQMTVSSLSVGGACC